MGMPAVDACTSPDAGAKPVALTALLRAFGMIGVSSFGGGMSGWLYREIVERLRWISTHEFLAGQSLARAMPGANVVNLSIWIGYRLRGAGGALAATAGVLAGPLVLVIACATVYQHFARSVMLHRALLGIAAAALGLSLSMGLRTLWAAATRPVYVIVFLMTFLGVGVLHYPLLPVVAVLAPISIASAHFLEGRHER